MTKTTTIKATTLNSTKETNNIAITNQEHSKQMSKLTTSSTPSVSSSTKDNISGEIKNQMFCSAEFLEITVRGKAASLGSLYSIYDGEFFNGISLWKTDEIYSQKDTYFYSYSEISK